MRKRAGVVYTEYPNAVLYFVGYKGGSLQLIQTEGMAVVGHSSVPTVESNGTAVYPPEHLSCRFVQTRELWEHTHGRDGTELDPDEYDYYDIGIPIGPTEGEAYLNRVWFTSKTSKQEGFLEVIKGYERYMLDGYESQEDMEASIAAIGEAMRRERP